MAVEELEAGGAGLGFAGSPAHPAADPVQQWTAGYRDTFEELRATGADVAVMLDTPWPKEDAVECAAAHPMELARCGSRLPEAYEEPPEAYEDQRRRDLTRDAAEQAGFAVIDPVPWLCAPSGSCPVLVGNTIVYRDDSHRSETYAEALAPVLDKALAPLIGAR